VRNRAGNLADKASHSCCVGFFYMPCIYDMGPTALLPLRRKCVLGNFITHKNPPSSVGLEPATEYPVGPVASTLTSVVCWLACMRLRDFNKDGQLLNTEIYYCRYKTNHAVDVTIHTAINNLSKPFIT
jgi:hypothetical protein